MRVDPAAEIGLFRLDYQNLDLKTTVDPGIRIDHQHYDQGTRETSCFDHLAPRQ